MHSKHFTRLMAAAALAAAVLSAHTALAQDTGTAKTFISYFFTTSGTLNYEVTFSPGGYVSVADTSGYGLYVPAGVVIAGYFLILNTYIWRAPLARNAVHADDLLDKHDIFMLFAGVTTGATIQGVGIRLIDRKSPTPFLFFGYESSAQ